ncbi:MULTISPECIES: hypothetical protein [unclassified Chryseobacterium]|uniref:hypothetical protein n=1 Tax=unclassified Chryseobacterium TaxID=2593645 RepID=UPI001B468C9D|nr:MULTISPECIES: hypothetical protein [unclassified Chryseobacterium]MBP1167110.1 hypothetical protein [Chryseobacterium sp. PvR013]MDR4893514.1 hypothetical protein [Chryseobacterium sp. CFS7]
MKVSTFVPLWKLLIPTFFKRHGAAPDSAFAHIAINPNTQSGIVEWLQPVTDEEYNNLST